MNLEPNKNETDALPDPVESNYAREGQSRKGNSVPGDANYRRISIVEHLILSAYWFGSNFVWGALLGIVNAHEIEVMAPSTKAVTLGMLATLGAIPALVVPLIAGVLSDRCMHKWGRRRPYIAVGGAIAFVGIAALGYMASIQNLNGYFGAYFMVQFGANIAVAAYSGVIPDLVPEDQRGIASGYMAFMSQVSTLLGVLLGGMMIKQSRPAVYGGLLAVYTIFVILTLIGMKEEPQENEPEPLNWMTYFSSLVEPLKSKDFMWVWITRALMMLGFYALQPFVLYYLKDVIKVAEPEKSAGYILGIILVGATISGILGGAISDKTGRKPVVYAASIIISVMAVLFTALTSLTQVLIVGLIFGIGYGAYISVDWALGTDVLPNKEDSGKDMAVWHVSMTLPQQIAPLLGGTVLGLFVQTAASGDLPAVYSRTGYGALFTFSAVCFALGAVLLKNVKGAR